MSQNRGGWVHIIFTVACVLMVFWGLGVLGYIGNAHVAWWLMLVAWVLLMTWCYAYYVVQRRNRRSMRRT